MKFDYQARTSTGEIQTGIVTASSKGIALDILKKKNLYVTAIQKHSVPIYAKRLAIFERITEKDIMLFSRQLSIMFKSKVPLIEIFQTIAKQTGNPNFKEKILKVSEEVEAGTSLSNALALYPETFSPFYISMVKSGEASGKLTDVFMYLATHLEREHEFHSKIRAALIYPAFILVVFFSVITLVVTMIIPMLSEFLEQSGGELPWITKLVMGVSEFARSNFWIIGLIFVILVVVAWRLVITPKGRKLYNYNILRVPFINSFLKKLYLTRFALNLSTLISGGIPIVRALDITAEVVGNDVYRKVIEETKEGVRKGDKMSKVLAKYPELISPLFFQMVVVGEKTGTLDKSLQNAVAFYQDDIDRSTDTFIKLLEPLLIIVLGVVVGGLMAAVLLPIYSFGGDL